jgi:hypothetical protein
MRSFLAFLCCAFLVLACGDKNDTVTDIDTAVDADTAMTDALIPDTASDGDTLIPDDDGLLPADCTEAILSDAFLGPQEGFDAYWSFGAAGYINDRTNTSARPGAAFDYKLNLNLPGHPEMVIAKEFPFYIDGVDGNGAETIIFYALGDPGTIFYSTYAVTTLSKEWLVAHKEQLTADPLVNIPPLVRIFTATAASDTVVRQCIVAVNDTDPENPDLPAPGKMLVCPADNIEFATYENMYVAVNAKLTEDVDKILAILGLETEEELCSCADPMNNPVDCPGEETPDDDALVTD